MNECLLALTIVVSYIFIGCLVAVVAPLVLKPVMAKFEMRFSGHGRIDTFMVALMWGILVPVFAVWVVVVFITDKLNRLAKHLAGPDNPEEGGDR